MNKKVINILCIFLIFIFTISFICSVEATEAITAMEGLKDSSQAQDAASGKLSGLSNTIIGFVQIIGTAIAVIMATMLGIRYMLAAPGDKADVKKQIAPMVLGAILLFASVNIIQIVSDFADTLPD